MSDRRPLALLPGSRRRATLSGAAVLALIVTACGDSGTGPPAIGSITVSPPEATVDVGESLDLDATALDPEGRPLPGLAFEWSSSNPSAIRVDDGRVTALDRGEATVTATAHGETGEAAVTARLPVEELLLAPAESLVVVGETIEFEATPTGADGTPFDGAPVEWSSTPSEVLAIDENGRATAVAPGEAVVRATAEGVFAVAPIGVSPRYVEVATGSRHSCALAANGTVWCWGENDAGQLGTGEASPCFGGDADTCELVPTAVRADRSFTTLATGLSHTCALDDAGLAFCWGANVAGQIGDGTAGFTEFRLVPTPVSGGRSYERLTAGGVHTCAMTSPGTAYCWGRNEHGQLGDGSTTDGFTPTPVTGDLTFRTLDAGWDHTCGLTDADEPYCWGWNGHGQLGDGTDVREGHPAPHPVATPLHFTRITGGEGHSCAITADDAAYC